MKIPTLLGLSLLIIAIALGIAIFFYRQRIQNGLKVIYVPQKVQVVNITDSQATVTWQTDIPINESIQYGPNFNLDKTSYDDRDQNKKELRLTHFVTIKNLDPDTKYYFKIQKNEFFYPDKPLSFKTAKYVSNIQPISPLRGSILDSNRNPIDEALVFLKIAGASTLSTFTTTAGNFIIPLKNLRTEDLSDFFDLESTKEATLIITRGPIESSDEITLLKDKLLPPATLGENQDLRQPIASPEAKISNLPEKLAKFDLNHDGQVNSIDVSIVLDNFGRKPKIREADFNLDGVVDQKDLGLLEKALQ